MYPIGAKPRSEILDPHSNRREDWRENHRIIEKAFFELLEKTKKMPSHQDIADATGFGLHTIDRHFAEFDVSAIVEDVKVFSGSVLRGIAKSATKGNPASAKLYWQIVHEWSEKQKLEHTGKDGGPMELINLSDADLLAIASSGEPDPPASGE